MACSPPAFGPCFVGDARGWLCVAQARAHGLFLLYSVQYLYPCTESHARLDDDDAETKRDVEIRAGLG